MGGVETNTIIKVAIGKRLGLLITFSMLACGSASALTLKEAMVGVATNKSTIERDGKAYPIIPGMTCSVDIETGRRTILSFLLKPINKARQEAMSER